MKRIHRTLMRYAAVLAGIAAISAPALAADGKPPPLAPAELTDEHIAKAIEALVAELYERKDPDRHWEPRSWNYDDHGDESQAGGYTALVTLALLYAGESYQDPRLYDTIEWLETAGLSGTYAVAMRAHVWSLLPNRFRPSLHADASWLKSAFSHRVGSWAYDHNPSSGREDNSLAQYGALGLWEAAKRGVDVEDRYWQRLEERFINNQLEDGAWNYTPGRPGTGSMTAAGLTVLFITQDLLRAADAADPDATPDAIFARSMSLGMDWMADNFSPTENPGRDQHFYYYLYGIERVGLASGYKYFGSHDWFREGSAEIIRRLIDRGSDPDNWAVHEHVAGDGRASKVKLHHIAFSLMFLSRGRVPVAVNKLQTPGDSWNNRPRDVANFLSHLREVSETSLNWQIVSADADIDEWLDAPVLYLAGSDAPTIADPNDPAATVHRTKIREYLDRGGMLLAVNEGSTTRFAQAIEQIGTELYPHFAWRSLPDDHWAYSIHRPLRGRKPTLRGLSNGVRELIVLAPGDIAHTFQTRDDGDEARARFDTAANLYFYASELNRPRNRLDSSAIHAVDGSAPSRSISIVRGMYNGNWNPEPAALPMLFRKIASQQDVELHLSDIPIDRIGHLESQPDLLVICGVDEYVFSPAEEQAILDYAKAGGTILFETAGGMGDFARAAERGMIEALGKPARSARRSAIVTGQGVQGAQPLGDIVYRPFALETFGTRERSPRLRVINLSGRPALLFSREDISHALLDQPCWGISGYTTASARQLMTNVILYSMVQAE